MPSTCWSGLRSASCSGQSGSAHSYRPSGLSSAFTCLSCRYSCFAGGYATGLPAFERGVAVILAAMPSGAIAGVVADRYGCDGKLAAAIIVCTYVISLVTLPLIIMFGV